MCSLCGILGGRGHWTESAATPTAFESRRETHTRRRERQEQTRLLNKVLAPYGLSLSDWSGTAFLLKTRTGRSSLIQNPSELWPEAERLCGKPCDPLDSDFLAALDPA